MAEKPRAKAIARPRRVKVRHPMSKRWIFALPLIGALAGPTTVESAEACGMMLPHRLEDTVPSISQEHVVMIFDKENETEHFVREVRFDAGDDSFGFVVPTPTQPTVGAEKSPFKALGDAYPYETIPKPQSKN